MAKAPTVEDINNRKATEVGDVHAGDDLETCEHYEHSGDFEAPGEAIIEVLGEEAFGPSANAHMTRIINECSRQTLLKTQTAYVLATAKHESRMGELMIELSSGEQYEGNTNLGNIRPGDGKKFKGRGYVQLTGRRNYTIWAERLNLPLTTKPELAAEPDIAVKILVSGMRLGSFTGLGLSRFINTRKTDYRHARQIVNGMDRADLIAGYAKAFEAHLNGRPDPTDEETRSVQLSLARIGFPIKVDGVYGRATKSAVRHFQEGWAYEPPLAVDGIAGPKTSAALATSLKKGGRASANFKYAEFKSKGNGDIRVRRELILALEQLRSAMGNKPLTLISAYRDPAHNRRVKGRPKSRHLVGEAVDIPSSYGASLSKTRSLRRFSGIGYVASSKRVTHVDVRGLPKGSPHTTRTVEDPALWTY